VIETKGLCKFFGSIQAVKDVDLTIEKGEKIVIIGPSGCGKSTLLRMIAGLESFDRGQILLNQSSISKQDHSVGYMLQKDFLLPWRTIYKNVCLGLEIADLCDRTHFDYVDHLLSTYGLWEFRDKYPSQLSGGMRQRAALIRTLAIQPKLLLLDEAFSALDYQTRLQVTDDIYRILKRENISTILVTHDIPESICMGDRVIILSRRPATIKADIEIRLSGTPLTRRYHPDFNRYFDLIWKEMNDLEG